MVRLMKHWFMAMLMIAVGSSAAAAVAYNANAASVGSYSRKPVPADYSDTVPWGQKLSHYDGQSAFEIGDSVYFAVTFENGKELSVGASIDVFDPDDDPNASGTSSIGGGSCTYWKAGTYGNKIRLAGVFKLISLHRCDVHTAPGGHFSE